MNDSMKNAGVTVLTTEPVSGALGNHVTQNPATVGTALHLIFTIWRRIAIIFLDNANSAKDDAVYNRPAPAGQIPDSYPALTIGGNPNSRYITS